LPSRRKPKRSHQRQNRRLSIPIVGAIGIGFLRRCWLGIAVGRRNWPSIVRISGIADVALIAGGRGRIVITVSLTGVTDIGRDKPLIAVCRAVSSGRRPELLAIGIVAGNITVIRAFAPLVRITGILASPVLGVGGSVTARPVTARPVTARPVTARLVAALVATAIGVLTASVASWIGLSAVVLDASLTGRTVAAWWVGLVGGRAIVSRSVATR
jgi:hypothetical protein